MPAQMMFPHSPVHPTNPATDIAKLSRPCSAKVSAVDVVNFLPCGRHGGSSVSTGGGDGDGVVKSRRFVGSGKGRIKIRQGLRQTVTCSGRPSCDDRTTAGD